MLHRDSQVTQVDVLLVTVTEVETMAVRRLFPGAGKYFVGDKTYYELGEIGGALVFLVQSEMGPGGPGGSMRTIEKGIELLSPSAVILIGIAFGVDSTKQKVGDILVSQQILDYELQRVGQVNNALALVLRGDKVSVSPRLLNRCRDGAMEWQAANEAGDIQFGLLLSGAKLVDNQDFRQQLRTFAPEAIGGEMEGAGLYAAAQGNKVDWILIKAICDWADGNKGEDKVARQALAAERVARFVTHMIKQGGLRSERREPGQQAWSTMAHAVSTLPIDTDTVLQARTSNVEAILQKKKDMGDFDVFLCYNSRDRTEVKKIALALKARGVLPWLDEWELVPGQPWQRALEEQIRKSKAAAVFVGPAGMGPWHNSEMYAFLREMKKRNCPVIPVLLPGVAQEPELPIFLGEMSWVDFRKTDPDPQEQFMQGITRKFTSSFGE